MATNTVNGLLVASDGTNIPLKAEIAEGTESDLTVDSVYAVVSGQNVGDYAPGKTIVSGIVEADNSISYAYLLRRGQIVNIFTVGQKGQASFQNATCTPIRLEPGDKVRVLSQTASDRTAALCVYTASGVYRIFTVTPAGAATQTMTDIQTGNGFGDSIPVGDRVVKAYATSIDGNKIETAGVYVVDNLGNVVGSVGIASPTLQQPQFTQKSIPSGLNFAAQFLTNA